MTDAMTHPHRCSDAIALPADDDRLVGRTARTESYEVHVTRSSSEALTRLLTHCAGRQVALISDETTFAHFGGSIVDALRTHGSSVIDRTLADGERSKSLSSAVDLWHWLAASDLGRRDLLVCLGGGVVCDLGGWVASAYMRGIPYINLPTTLLAQVDGSLGGKVAVNHPLAKNLVGAFFGPEAVIADVSTLRSLPRRHLSAGIAECVKKAVIASPAYWELLDDGADALLAADEHALLALVRGACAIKLALIERDPYEVDLRRPLNFGHTIGHPLETVSGYAPLLHGEAVALGMAVESTVAAGRGLLAPDDLEQLLELLRRFALPVRGEDLPVRVHASAVVAALRKVRLIRAGSLRFVLPCGIGSTVIADDVTEAEIVEALAARGID